MDNREFYSQLGEDKWIFENLDLPANGVFVDIGCNDPINLNNTYAFEKYLGWSGIAVDVNFMFAPKWSKERPKSTLLIAAVLGIEVIMPNCITAMHPIEEHNFEVVRSAYGNVPEALRKNPVYVAAIDAVSVLSMARNGNIDLLSIDVEGCEFDILKRIFLSHLSKPRIIIAEHSTMWIEGKNTAIKDLCESHGYKTVYETALNYIFEL